MSIYTYICVYIFAVIWQVFSKIFTEISRRIGNTTQKLRMMKDAEMGQKKKRGKIYIYIYPAGD